MQVEVSTQFRAAAITPRAVFYDDLTQVRADSTLAWAPRRILAGTLDRFAKHSTIVVDGPEVAQHASQIEHVHADGWRCKEVGAWTLYHRADGRTVAMGLRRAMGVNHLGVLFDADTPADVVARRLGQYATATGGVWRGTPVTSALAAIRLSWQGSRAEPLWRLPELPPVRHAGPLVWRRPLTDQELSWGYVHEFDAVSAYLGAAGNAALGWSGVGHIGPQLFDPALPGWWHVRLEDAQLARLDDPMCPPFVNPRMVRDGCAWFATPMVEFLWRAFGDRCEIIDSYTGAAIPGSALMRPHAATARALLTWQQRMRDGWPVRVNDDAVVRAWKRTYKDAVGGMQRKTMRIWRPDWGHTIVDLWRATTLRRILRVYRSLGRYPVEVKTDSLAYAHWSPSPRDFAADLDLLRPDDPPQLGRYTHDAVHHAKTWVATQEKLVRRAEEVLNA